MITIPPATCLVLGLITAIQLLRMFVLTPQTDAEWVVWLGFVPLALTQGEMHGVWPWSTLVTCALLHFGWMHFLVNAAGIAAFGAAVERTFGVTRFLFILLFGVVAGALVHFAFCIFQRQHNLARWHIGWPQCVVCRCLGADATTTRLARLDGACRHLGFAECRYWHDGYAHRTRQHREFSHRMGGTSGRILCRTNVFAMSHACLSIHLSPTEAAMTDWHTKIATEQDILLAQLFDWLRIPSISADPVYAADTLYAAEWLQTVLLQANVDLCELWTTEGHPVVYAEKMIDPSLPTLLVYGHYDVQPPDPLELWTTPAFAPEIRDGKIYARGSCDDKGQTFLHVAALQLLQKNGALPCNLKFLIEGEEEIGSAHLGDVVQRYKDRLACDAIVISDTSMLGTDMPSLTVALRGLAYLEVEVKGFNRDLHSGVYGGAVDNPINALCGMIAQLKDENGRITIPGFYDPVVVHDMASRNVLNSRPQNDTNYAAAIGAKIVYGEKDFTTIERIGIRPCLDVNGIWGGYTRAGAKTVLPAVAHAKISMRLVPHQDYHQVTEQVSTYLQELCPPTMQVTVTPHHGGEPVLTNVNGKAYQAAVTAFTTVWGKTPIPSYEGASIPIAALLQREVSSELVFLGFGLDSDAIHSPNEHFRVDHFTKGLETVIAFYEAFGKR